MDITQWTYHGSYHQRTPTPEFDDNIPSFFLLDLIIPSSPPPPPPPPRPKPYWPDAIYGVFPLFSLPLELLILIAEKLHDPRCFRALSQSCKTLEYICHAMSPPAWEPELAKMEADRKITMITNLTEEITLATPPGRSKADVELEAARTLNACFGRGVLEAAEVMDLLVRTKNYSIWPERVAELLVRKSGDGGGGGGGGGGGERQGFEGCGLNLETKGTTS